MLTNERTGRMLLISNTYIESSAGNGIDTQSDNNRIAGG